MKNFIRKIKESFAVFKADRELDKAIHKAWMKCEENNRRYYVMPDTKHRLCVLSWTDIKRLKEQRVFNQFVTEADFIKESFFYTPSKVTEPGMSAEKEYEKRKMWHAYFKAFRM